MLSRSVAELAATQPPPAAPFSSLPPKKRRRGQSRKSSSGPTLVLPPPCPACHVCACMSYLPTPLRRGPSSRAELSRRRPCVRPAVQVGERVRLPEGGCGLVVSGSHGFFEVRLDGRSGAAAPIKRRAAELTVLQAPAAADAEATSPKIESIRPRAPPSPPPTARMVQDSW